MTWGRARMRGHTTRREVPRRRWVRIWHWMTREMGRGWMHEGVWRRQRVRLHRTRGRVHRGRVWWAWWRRRARVCWGCRGRLALPGRAGSRLSYSGRVVAEAQCLEGARWLRLGQRMMEGIGVGRLRLLVGLLLLLLRRGLLVRGRWVSQHGQYADDRQSVVCISKKLAWWEFLPSLDQHVTAPLILRLRSHRSESLSSSPSSLSTGFDQCALLWPSLYPQRRRRCRRP